MSRYRGYPRWALLTKAAIFLIALPVIIYLQLCGFMGMHYRKQFNRYENAGMAISAGWPELRNFDEYHQCLCYRYLAAGSATIDHGNFDLVWLVSNWNTDFLAKQPDCKR